MDNDGEINRARGRKILGKYSGILEKTYADMHAWI